MTVMYKTTKESVRKTTSNAAALAIQGAVLVMLPILSVYLLASRTAAWPGELGGYIAAAGILILSGLCILLGIWSFLGIAFNKLEYTQDRITITAPFKRHCLNCRDIGRTEWKKRTVYLWNIPIYTTYEMWLYNQSGALEEVLDSVCYCRLEQIKPLFEAYAQPLPNPAAVWNSRKAAGTKQMQYCPNHK